MTDFNDYYYDLQVPKLDLGSRKGWTDYIDFITWDEVKYSVMKGIDCLGRKFIVVKFLVDKSKIMQTFFQRYSNGEGWMGCGHATINLIDTSGYMNIEQMDFIRRIIEGETVKINENYSPCNYKFIDQKVELLDLEKIKAAKIIQNAWIQCRYNPKYKMCHRVQNRNLDIICGKN